ncbi:MAG: flagellar motor switch protein FliG [Opitutales bacterium]|nr:flagellar motor switch protein FliG [Opitutales bacterium]
MPNIEYDKLGKLQKLALFLIVIGPEAASEILRNFEDPDIELLVKEMSSFEIIDYRIKKRVIEDFYGIVSQSSIATLGGASYAQKTLEMAKGDFRASSILGRVAPVGSSVQIIEEIAALEPRQIFNLIRNEQSQTIAFIISYLHISKASALIKMLSSEMREEVVERIGSMESTALELVNKVVRTLARNLEYDEKQTFNQSGGVRRVADLLNSLDKDTSKTLLARLEEKNPSIGNAVRKKMFSFEDLLRLQPSDLQRVTREIDMGDLTVALKSTNPNLREAILGSISKRAAETLREEMELLGPVRLREVEAAQDKIIMIVRKLEEDGEITIDQEGADRVLV